jgi:hypothetical protein
MRFAFSIVAACAATACSPYSYSTRVDVNDPSHVEVRAPGAAEPALASGTPPGTQATVGTGAFYTGPRTSADYTVIARRDRGGGITIKVDTGLALSQGENVHIVSSTGVIDELYAGEESPPIDLSAPELVLPYCGDLAPTRYSHKVTLGSRCSAQPELRFDATTPWSNVKSVTVRRRAWGPTVWLAIALGAAINFELPGAIVLAASRGDGVGATIGRTFIGVGAAIQLIFLPWLFATDDDRLVYPR